VIPLSPVDREPSQAPEHGIQERVLKKLCFAHVKNRPCDCKLDQKNVEVGQVVSSQHQRPVGREMLQPYYPCGGKEAEQHSQDFGQDSPEKRHSEVVALLEAGVYGCHGLLGERFNQRMVLLADR
jgi:hypothetical protein